MENVSDALKIAAAVLLFVMALSIAMLSLSQARAASEAIIYARDEKNYYSYVDEEQYVDANKAFKTSRIVSMEAVIPTLYRYYIEQYRVEFYKQNGEKLVLYKVTDTPNTAAWRKKHSDEDKNINYLDLDDEMERNESWQGNIENTKQFIDMIVNGPIAIKRPDGSVILQTSSLDAPLFRNYSNRKFREELGEYTFQRENDQNNSALTDAIESHKQKKRVIRYTLIKE